MKQPLTVLLTPLGELELINAIEQRVFRKEISRTESVSALRGLQDDLQHGILNFCTLPSSVYDRAKQLSRKYTAAIGGRTIDIIHIAAALTLGVHEFYTFDLNQNKFARATGLKVKP